MNLLLGGLLGGIVQHIGHAGDRLHAWSVVDLRPDGDRLAGAAKGATAGAVVGGAQGNQYENAPDAMQDKHRENQAKCGAAAGMAVAGSRNRQERRGERKSADDQQAAWQSSHDACMAAK